MPETTNIYFFIHLGYHLLHQKSNSVFRIDNMRKLVGQQNYLSSQKMSKAEKFFLKKQFSIYGQEIKKIAANPNNIAVLIGFPLEPGILDKREYIDFSKINLFDSSPWMNDWRKINQRFKAFAEKTLNDKFAFSKISYANLLSANFPETIQNIKSKLQNGKQLNLFFLGEYTDVCCELAKTSFKKKIEEAGFKIQGCNIIDHKGVYFFTGPPNQWLKGEKKRKQSSMEDGKKEKSMEFKLTQIIKFQKQFLKLSCF